MKRYLIILNCKAVDDRQTEKGARKCASSWCKKFPAWDGHIVEVFDSLSGEYII